MEIPEAPNLVEPEGASLQAEEAAVEPVLLALPVSAPESESPGPVHAPVPGALKVVPINAPHGPARLGCTQSPFGL